MAVSSRQLRTVHATLKGSCDESVAFCDEGRAKRDENHAGPNLIGPSWFGVTATMSDNRTRSVGWPGDAPAIAVPWGRVRRLAFAIATLLGLSSVAFVYFGMIAGGRPLTLRTAILAGLPN